MKLFQVKIVLTVRAENFQAVREMYKEVGDVDPNLKLEYFRIAALGEDKATPPK